MYSRVKSSLGNLVGDALVTIDQGDIWDSDVFYLAPHDNIWPWHIEDKTKWLAFSRQDYQMHFLEKKMELNFFEVFSLGHSWHKSSLVQIMSLSWNGDKPLHEPMKIHFNSSHAESF